MGKDTKAMFMIIVATLLIIGGGAFLLSRNQNAPAPKEEKVNQDVLIKSDSHKIQAPKEKTVLVEFGDFQCPACGSYAPIVKKLTEEFKDEMSFVFRNYPLPQHKNGRLSAYAAEAAGKQGKYWEMFDKIYSTQSDWSESDSAEGIFTDYAKGLALDTNKFKEDLKSQDVKKRVDADYADGAVLGVNSTPTFFLDGAKIVNPTSYENFQTLAKAAILNSKVSITGEEKYHAHFDFALYLNGKPIDFTQDKYQESDKNKLDDAVHFHDGNGKVVHLHKKGVTLGQFLKSLKMDLNNTCFTSDNPAKYCTSGAKTLKMFVNGKDNKDFEKYVPQDLDRILITYGSETGNVLQKQIDSVSNDSCIYSEKCPERGKPPTENCVGGLGSGCDEQ